MTQLFKPLATTALLAMAATAAQAQNVLMLTTQEASSSAALTTIRDAYMAAGATVNYQRGALSSTTPLASSTFDGYDVVVLVTILERMNDAQLPVLDSAMRNRPGDNTAFVLYIDGCCDTQGANTQNVSRMTATLSGLTGWPLGSSGRQITAGGNNLPLNTASPYAAPFAAHAALNPTLRGHDYRVVTGVPAASVVYDNDPARATPGAFTFFVPRNQSNSGRGACVLFTGDSSHMSPGAAYQAQKTATVQASLALAASAHCQRAQPAQVQPVPTMQAGGLALLSVGMALSALRRRRKGNYAFDSKL